MYGCVFSNSAEVQNRRLLFWVSHTLDDSSGWRGPETAEYVQRAVLPACDVSKARVAFTIGLWNHVFLLYDCEVQLLGALPRECYGG